MKKIALLALCLVLALGVAAAEVNGDFAAYESFGKVIGVTAYDNGAAIVAEGYYGYHMDEEPSMTVSVAIGKDGTVKGLAVMDAKAQTPGFDTMITQDYLDAKYVGQPALSTLEVDAVAGATATSQAVRYAVQTACYYAQNALGYNADTNAEDKATLRAVVDANYQTIETDYKPNKNNIGTVLYAARGITPDGRNVMGIIAKSALKFSYKGSAGTGWTASEPSAFIMAIVVDESTNKVCGWNITKDGTKHSAIFKVPDEKINTYCNVEITDEKIFDDFMDGLVIGLEFEKESSEDGPVITGTSIVYTGATEQGSFSSQLIRNCFRTVAAYYCNVKP